ncbi:MAG: methyltransferase [Verrucomicrobiae bacterium]|nr:methyltransferase [Verrucomicrobiae bacterium]MDW7980978.1 uroporphyrinogen decarboxylase family protein [Verrucomicrobiales bacterium]
MNSRERIQTALAHREPDRVPVDFGGGFQTGMHVSVVYKLRQALKLDPPGTPVKVVEVYQMLGEIAPDLRDALGIDTVNLGGTGTMFGFPQLEFKEWQLADGTPVLVPKDFNTQYEPNGDLLQWPGNDRSVLPSGRMPAGGHFFDAIVRQEPIDEARLNPADNTEEFQILPDEEFEHYRRLAHELYTTTDKALFCTFPGLSFGDIALVPATFLKRPRGIRDVEEWYVSLVTRPAYIKAVFERQTEVALENLRRLHKAVGDLPTVIQTSGTDFGTQQGPFLSAARYRELFLPYQKAINGWIHRNTKWKTFMHCCGGIEPLIECFIEAEFDILNPVQCSAKGMEPRTLKKQYGDRLVFWGGGVDTQRTLPFGTPDEVYREVRERIEIFGEGGGYVFSTIHNVQANTPVENLLAMFRAIKDSTKG